MINWVGVQGWAAAGGLTLMILGIIFASGKFFQEHIHTKDKLNFLEREVKALKERETAVELVKQAVEGLKEQFIELRQDLREFISIEIGRKRSDGNE